jgi:putative membrane protein
MSADLFVALLAQGVLVMHKITLIATTFALLFGPAMAQDKASQKFITEAIHGNFAEVSMGQLAQQNGASEEVKAYGQILVSDHGSANQQAQQAASSVGVTAPPTESNAKQKADHDKMAKMNGAAFDREFASHMVKDHKKDIAAYTKASKKTDAAGQYAKSTLPTLQKHLETAQSLQRKITKQ